MELEYAVSTEVLEEILGVQKDLYCLTNDRIIFVVDDNYINAPLYEVFADYECFTIHIPKVQNPGQDYTLNDSLLEGMTLGWLITTKSVSHAKSTKKMVDKGMFIISNPGITPDWVEILTPEKSKLCEERSKKLLNALGGNLGGEIHITSEDGTDLYLNVPRQNWQPEFGKREGVGTNGVFGEVFTAPYDARGTYVLNPGDFLTNPINRVREKIILTIELDRVVKIEGGEQAEQLQQMLKKGNEFAFYLGEFSFGLNDAEREKLQTSVVAEKVFGSVHIAIGTNSMCLKKDCPDVNLFPNGRYNAGVHIDCIKFGANIWWKPSHGFLEDLFRLIDFDKIR